MESANHIVEDTSAAACFNILSKELAELSLSMIKSPKNILEEISIADNCNILTKEFAIILDKKDCLTSARTKFNYPLKKDFKFVEVDANQNAEEKECIYLCGNSLGLKPKRTTELVNEQLEKWGKLGVEMHFEEPLPAALCDRYGRESLGRLVGSDPECVSLMNALTTNLHLLLVSFYQPTKDRYKILIENQAFPSDRYAVKSQAAVRGFNPIEAVIEIAPRKGETLLRTEDILQLIEDEGTSIAVLCLSGVQYYTGQKFDMEKITKAAQMKGCLVGWDLAHAIGNVSLQLDKWGVDFACWCTYKYLNSGPGCIAGAYVNRRHKTRKEPHFLGWWSNAEETRFKMLHDCDISKGIDSFRLSNPSPMQICCVLASLELFDEYGMDKLLAKQYLLTGYLELLLDKKVLISSDGTSIARIISPRDPLQRGCQISIEFNISVHQINEKLKKKGVLCDIRLPNAMRIAPVPLYNSFLDVYNFVNVLHQTITTYNKINCVDIHLNGQK